MTFPSKIEHEKFRFTGVDIERVNKEHIKVSMNDYAESLENIKEF